jgi:hypothetical protein
MEDPPGGQVLIWNLGSGLYADPRDPNCTNCKQLVGDPKGMIQKLGRILHCGGCFFPGRLMRDGKTGMENWITDLIHRLKNRGSFSLFIQYGSST